MFVPKNSGRKRCNKHRKEHNNNKYREWYSEQPRKCREKAYRKQKEKLSNDVQYRLYCYSKKSAKERGLEHNIELEDIQVPEKCPVFNCEMTKGTPYAPTLDRVDASKGYIKGNVQVISWKANTMKSDATQEELVLFAKWVIE